MFLSPVINIDKKNFLLRLLLVTLYVQTFFIVLDIFRAFRPCWLKC